MVSITFAYIYFNQEETDEKQYNDSGKTVNDSDVANEIDDMFIEEDNDIEIGDIV